MKKQPTLGWILLGCLVFLLCTSTASGQAVYGSIVGTITDQQGAAVAGAKVVVTSVEKGNSTETTTNESGGFTVLHLIPDNYKVHVEAQGFKAYEVVSVLVQVDQTARVDAQLQVGAMTQRVEVTGELPQLQTEKSDVSTTFQSLTIESLPI